MTILHYIVVIINLEYDRWINLSCHMLHCWDFPSLTPKSPNILFSVRGFFLVRNLVYFQWNFRILKLVRISKFKLIGIGMLFKLRNQYQYDICLREAVSVNLNFDKQYWYWYWLEVVQGVSIHPYQAPSVFCFFYDMVFTS